MKHTKINKYIQPNNSSIFTKDKYYCVFLDKDLTIYFTSKKETEKFMCFLRSEIDNLIISSNTALIEIYKFYRCAWFYSSEIRFSEFKDIEENLNKIVKYQHSENANYFIIKNIEMLFKNMNQLIDQLIEVLKHNKLYLDVRTLTNIKKRLKTEYLSLFNILHQKNKIR